ncbi:ABC-2 type transport system ATP-binding protein [Aneurinibacillus soli]|uniref:ABC transporter ATP-binding protein YtrB n=1 Tax=Aneurinibacillus soli TaxID=1500254 RepID=A0A0U4WN07_9BACL|nr:ABC transporter ATP-binding protein [Aneurinibacillus soli]PYE61840.1 ABC-2 type transport system ATP-binding protein [Aneurinibacillus soli]BAU29656.1 ABC transporter ATP-binding protein YtrB [Aneurinibacillus soli]
MIELQNVSKRYITQSALTNISLTLPKGKIIGIIGENGSGKSTTLKLIAGLIQPTSGTILVDGIPVTRRISQYVAYLSELDQLYDFYTVQEIVKYYASQYPDFDQNKAQDMIQFFKLDPTKKVAHLSKGNRGRVKLVLTLSRNVPYILMDEPLSGLDPLVRDSVIRSLISFINFEEQTVIITTHEIAEIEPLLDYVIMISNGQVLASTEVEQIREQKQQSLLEWMKQLSS